MGSSLNAGRLGNTSASSLVRSASTIRTEMNTYQDTVQRIKFENNPSDAGLQEYLSYLGGRVDQLSTTGSITDATKAAEMQQTMHTAVAKNTSFNIQYESIQVMAGNASNQDKMGYLTSAFQRATSIGDMTLAQSLESQAYSLDQTMQYQGQVAAEAQQTLVKANGTAMKSGYTDAVGQIKNEVSDALSIIHSGSADPKTALKNVSATIDSTLKALTGKGLPKGAQANIGSVIQGAFNAEFAYAQHASDALRATDPSAADKFAKFDAKGNIVGGQAYDIMSNQSTMDVPGLGKINAMQAQQWANNPNLFGTKTDIGGNLTFYRNPIVGYNYVNGVLTPQTDQAQSLALQSSTGKAKNVLADVGITQPGQQASGVSKQQLEKLGFSVVKVNGDGTIDVKFTQQTDKWTQGKDGNSLLSSAGLGSGNVVKLIPQSNGSFQFASGNRLLSIGVDTRGLGGIFEHKATGGTVALAGQYGFNQTLNTMIGNATVQQLQARVAAEAAAAEHAREVQALSAAHIPTANIFHAPQPGAMQGGTGPSAYTNQNPAARGSSPYQMSQRQGGGFNFTLNGKAISAAQYASGTGQAFRGVLQTMANAGDSGARSALGFVGNDMHYDPGKIGQGQNANLYNSLTWGTGLPSAHVNGPTISGGQLVLPSGVRL